MAISLPRNIVHEPFGSLKGREGISYQATAVPAVTWVCVKGVYAQAHRQLNLPPKQVAGHFGHISITASHYNTVLEGSRDCSSQALSTNTAP